MRLYLDSSVYGGCEDAVFAEASHRVIESLQRGEFTALVTEEVIQEVSQAPESVSRHLFGLPDEHVELIQISAPMYTLREMYVAHGILSMKHAVDMMHVAAATVASADALVSWNFRHIVRLDKMREFNVVNERMGYPPILLVSPIQLLESINEF